MNIPILNMLNVDRRVLDIDRIAAMTSLEKTIVRSIDTDFDRSQPIESPRSTFKMREQSLRQSGSCDVCSV
jgi:hypothetical protein